MDIRAGLIISSTDHEDFVYIGLKLRRDSLSSSLVNSPLDIPLRDLPLVWSFIFVISGCHNIELRLHLGKDLKKSKGYDSSGKA